MIVNTSQKLLIVSHLSELFGVPAGLCGFLPTFSLNFLPYFVGYTTDRYVSKIGK